MFKAATTVVVVIDPCPPHILVTPCPLWLCICIALVVEKHPMYWVHIVLTEKTVQYTNTESKRYVPQDLAVNCFEFGANAQFARRRVQGLVKKGSLRGVIPSGLLYQRWHTRRIKSPLDAVTQGRGIIN